jgi:hypothetical protein
MSATGRRAHRQFLNAANSDRFVRGAKRRPAVTNRLNQSSNFIIERKALWPLGHRLDFWKKASADASAPQRD